jgi:two-component system cell cycle sensor histidine kinase/response regulator CckA
LWQPIKQHDGRVNGYLYLQHGIPPVYYRVPLVDFIMVFVVAVSLALVFAVVLRGLRRFFLAPLADLVQTTNNITQNADYTVRANVRHEDELGDLARVYNQMLEAIGQRDAALSVANEQLRSIFNAATDVAIIATKPDGTVSLFNRGAEQMIGFSAAEAIGQLTPQHWHVPEEIAARGRELTAQEGRQIMGFDTFVEPARLGQHEAREWTLVRKDGSTFQSHLAVTAIRNAQNEITGFLGVISDITQRKRAEAELQQREHYFRSLIEHSADIILVLDPQNRITFNSPSCERLTGCQPGELLQKDYFTLLHPDDQARMQAALSPALPPDGDLMKLTVRMRHTDGSWRQVEVIGHRLPPSAGTGSLILNARDVTENLKLEEQFRQAQKMEAVGRLSGGIAHDFNNVLTVIQGNVSLLETSPDLPAEDRESVLEIREGVERATALTRQLLAFSRRQPIQLADLDLNAVVSNMLRMLKRIVGEDIEMELRHHPQLGGVRADPGMIEQVVFNLVINARDAMPNGGHLVIETSLIKPGHLLAMVPAPETKSPFACLTISDTGCGIAPDVLPRIFEPFFTTKDIGKGTGLGLATVYGIVQQHGGWITVDSTPGQGTSFRVYLPQSGLEPETTPAAAPQLDVPGGTETILLVEDEPALRALAKKCLTRLGYTVLEAPTGAQAKKIWTQHRDQINLLFTDMVMPEGVSGPELARFVHTQRPELKIIFTSGYTHDTASAEFPLQDGVNFLPKPFKAADMARIIRQCLDASPASNLETH